MAKVTLAAIRDFIGQDLGRSHWVTVDQSMIDQFADPGPERATLESHQLLDEQVRHIEEAGGTVAEAHLRLGRPDNQIIEVGEEVGAGLIVVGSRGHGGVRRALMGSVSDSVVRHAHCPVLVVRE